MPEQAAAAAAALLVTRNFPPLLGGMENVNARLFDVLAERGPIGLCGPAGCRAYAGKAALVCEAPVRPLWRFVTQTAWNALRAARRIRPTFVLAGSGLAAPMAWIAARVTGARLVVYLHGLDIIVEDRLYQAVWMPFVRACDLVLVNSNSTAALAAGNGIDRARVRVLHPGTLVPEIGPGVREAERRELGLGERPILLSVGRLTRRKGLCEFVQFALPAIASRHPDVLLVVVGGEAADALSGGGTTEAGRILAAASAAGVGDNLRFLGRCDDARLSRLYQMADLHVFPVLELRGDVEGFGMVALESAAHGLRTVGFAVGGVPDAVLQGVTGSLVPPADYAALARAVSTMLETPASEADRQASRRFASAKDWTCFGDRLNAVLDGTP